MTMSYTRFFFFFLLEGQRSNPRSFSQWTVVCLAGAIVQGINVHLIRASQNAPSISCFRYLIDCHDLHRQLLLAYLNKIYIKGIQRSGTHNRTSTIPRFDNSKDISTVKIKKNASALCLPEQKGSFDHKIVCKNSSRSTQTRSNEMVRVGSKSFPDRTDLCKGMYEWSVVNLINLFAT